MKRRLFKASRPLLSELAGRLAGSYACHQETRASSPPSHPPPTLLSFRLIPEISRYRAEAVAMSPVGGGGNAGSGSARHEESTAAIGGGDSAPAGLGRPSRVSAATALASFSWTDAAIVEVTGRALRSHTCSVIRCGFPPSPAVLI